MTGYILLGTPSRRTGIRFGSIATRRMDIRLMPGQPEKKGTGHVISVSAKQAVSSATRNRVVSSAWDKQEITPSLTQLPGGFASGWLVGNGGANLRRRRSARALSSADKGLSSSSMLAGLSLRKRSSRLINVSHLHCARSRAQAFTEFRLYRRNSDL